MKVVLDTNVLLSALHFGGTPRAVLEKAIRGEVKLYLSDPILAELLAVLQRPKFCYPEEALQAIQTELTTIGYMVRPSMTIKKINADPSDNKILECALEAGADYIVSGDAHLLNLQEYKTIRIVTPAQFLQIDIESEAELK